MQGLPAVFAYKKCPNENLFETIISHCNNGRDVNPLQQIREQTVLKTEKCVGRGGLISKKKKNSLPLSINGVKLFFLFLLEFKE